jgi:hypothetical protein
MNQILKKITSQIPSVKKLLKYQTMWEPGHYYSPIPDEQTALMIAERSRDKLFNLKGIDLREESQIKLFDDLVPYMKESSFRNEQKIEGHRFYNKNGAYGYSDALILEAMIRHLKPTRIIEAGSGFSSALMMDVNEKYFDRQIHLEFIEPFPERLLSFLTTDDKKRVGLNVCGLQTIDLSLFQSLEKNDILFIDSTHVAKAGSDLLFLFFEILPVLKSGVYIHFHDIFNNFEYMAFHYQWSKGFAWNENYFLRSFLMYNTAFEIVLFSNFLDTKYKDLIEQTMPDYPFFTGAQFWMKKL